MSDALILGYIAPNTTNKHSKPASSSSVDNTTSPRTASNKRGSTASGRTSRWSGVPWYYRNLPQKWA